MAIAVNLGSPWLKQPKAFALVVKNLLDNIVKVNRISIRHQKENLKRPFPPLYESGVIYKSEPRGYDSFVDIYRVIEAGHGDCAHLAAWRVAELLEQGIPATIMVEWRALKPPHTLKVFHVKVRLPNGRLEDPSAILGMRTSQKITG